MPGSVSALRKRCPSRRATPGRGHRSRAWSTLFRAKCVHGSSSAAAPCGQHKQQNQVTRAGYPGPPVQPRPVGRREKWVDLSDHGGSHLPQCVPHQGTGQRQHRSFDQEQPSNAGAGGAQGLEQTISPVRCETDTSITFTRNAGHGQADGGDPGHAHRERTRAVCRTWPAPHLA